MKCYLIISTSTNYSLAPSYGQLVTLQKEHDRIEEGAWAVEGTEAAREAGTTRLKKTRAVQRV